MVNCSSESRLGSFIAKCVSKPIICVDPCPVPTYSPVLVGAAIVVTVYVLTKRLFG